MGFVVHLSTKDKEQKIFKLRTIKPIPMAVYDTPNMWVKYGHHILPPNQYLKRFNKVGLHWSFCGSLNEFLCTDLDENLSFTNPHCVPKFNEYFSNLFKGMSETKYKVQIFEKRIKNEKFKRNFMDHMMDTAILGTMIPLSICTIFVHRRFDKHSILESMLERILHFYIQMVTEPDEYSIFPGDIVLYT